MTQPLPKKLTDLVPAEAATEDDRRRQLSAERQRRQRYRDRNDICMMADVPVTADILDMMTDLHWLDPDMTEDSKYVGAAIGAMLGEAASTWKNGK